MRKNRDRERKGKGRTDRECMVNGGRVYLTSYLEMRKNRDRESKGKGRVGTERVW